jgi:hypothetical protein
MQQMQLQVQNSSSSDEEQLLEEEAADQYDEEYFRQKILQMEEYEKLRLQLVEKVQEINNRLRQYRAANARLI